MTKTEWYPGEVKPMHSGVYERHPTGREAYNHWNGAYWGLTSDTPSMAFVTRRIKSKWQTVPWRGLKEPTT